MTAQLMQNESMKEKLRMSIPLKKFCTTDDIAVAVLYLASNEASVVTGETIIVDGGFHAV
jgi:enoyl-[acyl-carrier-protein] reductase (NADH)